MRVRSRISIGARVALVISPRVGQSLYVVEGVAGGWDWGQRPRERPRRAAAVGFIRAVICLLARWFESKRASVAQSVNGNARSSYVKGEVPAFESASDHV